MTLSTCDGTGQTHYGTSTPHLLPEQGMQPDVPELVPARRKRVDFAAQRRGEKLALIGASDSPSTRGIKAARIKAQ